MDKTYKILSVQARDPWTGQYGTFNSFALQLEGVDGFAELSQKETSPAPLVGSEITGSLSSSTSKDGSKTYMKFKRAQKPFGGAAGNNGGGGYVGFKEDISYIIMMLEEMTLRRISPENPQPRDGKPGIVDILPSDEEMSKPIDLSKIPF